MILLIAGIIALLVIVTAVVVFIIISNTEPTAKRAVPMQAVVFTQYTPVGSTASGGASSGGAGGASSGGAGGASSGGAGSASSDSTTYSAPIDNTTSSLPPPLPPPAPMPPPPPTVTSGTYLPTLTQGTDVRATLTTVQTGPIIDAIRTIVPRITNPTSTTSELTGAISRANASLFPTVAEADAAYTVLIQSLVNAGLPTADTSAESRKARSLADYAMRIRNILASQHACGTNDTDRRMVGCQISQTNSLIGGACPAGYVPYTTSSKDFGFAVGQKRCVKAAPSGKTNRYLIIGPSYQEPVPEMKMGVPLYKQTSAWMTIL